MRFSDPLHTSTSGIQTSVVENKIYSKTRENKNNTIFLDADKTLKKIEGIREEVNKLYEAEDIEECLHKIKEGLKACNNGINVGNYYEQEYELFLKLGDIYSKREDKLDYPKAVGIYQYVLNIIDKLPDGIDKEGRKREVENKIGLVEEEFIKQYGNNKQLSEGYSGKRSLERIGEYKTGLEEHREWVKGELKRIEDLGIKEGEEELDEEGLESRAEEVERIYGEIREYFIGDNGLIKQLLNNCIKELGGLPKVIDKRTGEEREVEYAAFGMGSMALGTMTPWSDIECGIAIEEGLDEEKAKEVKEYFRSLTTLMYIKVINFGEGVLNYQGIKELNDLSRIGSAEDYWFVDMLSPKGFCFDATLPDGCKTPLGRQGHRRVIKSEGREELTQYKNYELIGTISEMLEFQEDASWEKHDMTLVQALWHIVPISGSKRLIEKYQTKLEDYREKIEEKSFAILKKDNLELNPFGQIISGDKEGQILKVKREIYRFPDRILIALGDCIGNIGNNGWEIVRFLLKQEEREEDKGDFKRLQIALSIATELRLRTYAHNDSRKEDLSASARYESKIKELKEAETEEVFYIKDIRILYSFYYIILPLSITVSSTENQEKLRELYKKVSFVGTTPVIKGYIYKRFIKYYEAIKEFEKINPNEISIFLKESIAGLYHLVGNNEKALQLYEEIHKYVKLQHKEEHTTIAYSLNNIGNVLRSLGRHKEALEKHQESLKMQKEIFKGDHPNTTSLLNNAGNVLQSLARYEEALESHQESLVMTRRIYKGDHPNLTASLTNIGNVLQSLARYEEALESHQESLVMTRRIYKGDHPNLTASLTNIGNVLQSLARYEEALESHQESLVMTRRIYRDDHPDIANSLNNIGYVLQNLGRYEEALESHQESLNMRYRIYKGDHSDIAISLNNIGYILLSLGQYKEALESHQESLVMTRRTYTDDHPDIANSLTNIGNVLQSSGRYEGALKKYRESLVMTRRIYRDDHPAIADSLSNIGDTLLSLGQYEEALASFEESLAMQKKIFKGNHPAIAASLTNIGNIVEILGLYKDALEKHQESLEMKKKIFKGDHPGIATSLNNIGYVFQKLGLYEDALGKHQESLAMQERIFKGDHSNIAISLNNIGNVLRISGRYEEALARHQESLDMQKKIYKGDHHDIARSLNNIGIVLGSLGQYEEALASFEESLAMQKKIYKGDHSEIADSLTNIGNALEGLKNYEDALERQQDSLDMKKRIYKDDHSNIAASLTNIGNTLVSLGRYEEALKRHQESLDMMRRVYKDDHSDIAGSLTNMGNTLVSLGRYQEAYDYSKQSYDMLVMLELIDNHPKHQLTKYLLKKCTMLLANREMILNNDAKGFELYSLVGIEVDHLKQHIMYLTDIFWNNKDLDLAISCYEVLSKKLDPQVRYIKHNLACMYHAKAISLYKNNNMEQYEEYISKSKEVFELAINLESDKPASSALYTEYSMFLVKCHDTSNAEEYIRIESLLNNAIKLKEDGSGLEYNQLEKITIVEPLQELLNKRDNVSIEPYILAYYLLVKIHNLRNEKGKAKEAVMNFDTMVKSVKREDSEVPLTLLIAAYKELGFNFQAKIYQEILDEIVCSKQEGIEK
ncbi:hypothetical protein NF27_AK00060 [Candidatus Jidaibacter acanthamoeba]|uniref:Uncharacterized protein n=1 Tax=Candidatus Jidaibacter acanthamoebae TaxID=86105 RepID=A0A0C1QL93_9RICK|nr:tetratricopeptide repeat protein [Candidatus Jidaibacter acanthamoeba]KIE06274.1 hypothetical protein NF27_AK00060 [Candidatus Jidaibacter acanthamoeba]